MSQVSVIILAAGAGTRLGHATPKQFLEVAGRRLLDYSVDTLAPWADQTIVVVPPASATEALALPDGAQVVVGGAARADSVRAAVSHARHDLILIHDAARPFVTTAVAQAVVDALADADSAYPVIPVSSSVVVDEDGALDSTPERRGLREVQTPQGFRAQALREVLEQDEPHPHLPEAVRLAGGSVAHVEGSPWLFKVTYAPSLHAAEYYAAHGWDQQA